jgi:hypothetical protein
MGRAHRGTAQLIDVSLALAPPPPPTHACSGVHAVDRRPAGQGHAAGGACGARAANCLTETLSGTGGRCRALLQPSGRPGLSSSHPHAPWLHAPEPNHSNPPSQRDTTTPPSCFPPPPPDINHPPQRILASGHSRVPVYEGSDRSAIQGLIIAKELLQYAGLLSGPQVTGCR